MTGILDHDKCQAGCAAGPIVTFPVRVVATDPRTCALETFQSGAALPAQSYVYSKVSVSAVSGNPPSYLVGDSVFKVCSSPGTAPLQRPARSHPDQVVVGAMLSQHPVDLTLPGL